MGKKGLGGQKRVGRRAVGAQKVCFTPVEGMG